MTQHTTSLRKFQLALVASAAVALGACSKNDASTTPTAANDTPAQVAVAPVPAPVTAPVTAPAPAPVAPAPAPVVVAQNNSYDQGRRDQQRADARAHARAEAQREQALREPPPRADRDADIAQQRYRHEQQVAAAACQECGVVASVTAVEVQGKTNGVGAVAGGVGGALVGNRIAGGNNRTLGGVVGAVGGGLLGNAIEKHQRKETAYDVDVRMEDGSHRTVRQSTAPAVGDKVRVEADGLHQRG